jgi:hypothetical protein
MLQRNPPVTTRRRAIAWSAAIVALAIGLGGTVALIRVAASGSCRGQLQSEADRTALKLANALTEREDGVDLAKVSNVSGPITLGHWNATRRRFQPGSVGVNAVQVVVEGLFERNSRNWWSPLFAPDRVMGKTHAVAAVRPRDIVFVVDLSSTMTGETRTALGQLLSSATDEPAVAEDGGLPELYTDLGFETCPGPLEPFGAPWRVGEGWGAYEALISEFGPLVDPTTAERYRIAPGDSASTRRRKAYLAVIDQQIMRVMPRARPRPDRPENYEYWAGYLDEVLASNDRYPRIGYASYIRYMLRQGRSIQVGGQHVPLSQFSDECTWHSDMVDGTQYRFPPRTQPMHEVRRGLLGALRDVAIRNCAFEPGANRDRVAIVTFDSLSPGGAWLEQPLTSDYRAVSKKVTRLQAVGERAQSTAGLAALQLAERLLRRSLRETSWVRDASPLVVFVTTGPTHSEAVDAQIAKMTQLGQSVKVIPVGRATESVTAMLPATIGGSPFFNEGGGLSDGHGYRKRYMTESSFRAAVASASIVLVE